MKTPSGREYTLADTVGFVRHLPHQLVEAFGSTLDEVNSADLLVHVVDGHDADPIDQLNAVREVLGQIDATHIPELVVINKADLATPTQLARVRGGTARAVVASAATGEGIDEVAVAIAEMLPQPDVPMKLLVPFTRGELVSELHSHADVLDLSYLEDGTLVDALVPQWLAPRLDEFRQ
jgi:GTP-binding protein HflX